MPKDTKTNKKEKEIKKISGVDELEEETEEILPEDVQDALGINKAKKTAKIKEVDYISELENGLDDFDIDDKATKPSFDEDFDSDIE